MDHRPGQASHHAAGRSAASKDGSTEARTTRAMPLDPSS
jgi:hypothetical protein